MPVLAHIIVPTSMGLGAVVNRALGAQGPIVGVSGQHFNQVVADSQPDQRREVTVFTNRQSDSINRYRRLGNCLAGHSYQLIRDYDLVGRIGHQQEEWRRRGPNIADRGKLSKLLPTEVGGQNLNHIRAQGQRHLGRKFPCVVYAYAAAIDDDAIFDVGNSSNSQVSPKHRNVFRWLQDINEEINFG